MVARVATALGSAVVVAWLAMVLVADHDFNQASQVPAGGLPQVVQELKSPRRFAARLDLLHKAGFLNPDTTPELQIARYYALRSRPGDLAHALRIVASIVRREPQNLTAWVTMYVFEGNRHDSAAQRAAAAQIHRLDPLMGIGS